MDARHFINGRRPHEKGFHIAFVRLVLDYLRFAKTLAMQKYDIIHLNPSLNVKGVLRDSVFMFVARHIFRMRTIVFFHGWETEYAEKLKGWKLGLFRYIFKEADATLVLANDFKETLLRWGFRNDKVIVETTAFDDTLTEDLAIHQAITNRLSGCFNIVFFARLIKEKGIYETLETFGLLTKRYPQMRLLIAGDGEEFAPVKAFVETSHLRHATMVGYVQNQEKKAFLTKSSLLFLPSYSEGLPISVVEAMAVGLPVVTRSVGGIKDFFLQGKHGFTTESKDPKVFAEFISELYERHDLYEAISLFNYNYAKDHFAGSEVRRRIEMIYKKVGEGVGEWP